MTNWPDPDSEEQERIERYGAIRAKGFAEVVEGPVVLPTMADYHQLSVLCSLELDVDERSGNPIIVLVLDDSKGTRVAHGFTPATAKAMGESLIDAANRIDAIVGQVIAALREGENPQNPN